MNPGIYRNLPFDEYKAIQAWNPSLIWHARRSPKYCNHIRHNPKPATPAMGFGSAIHCAVLEPDQFILRYCVWTGGRRSGKDYAEFCNVNDVLTVLTVPEYEACCGARDSARSHPVAGQLLADTLADEVEVSLVWTDSETGLLCKGRPDILQTDLIINLKSTTADISDTRALTRIASTLGYHMKEAAYQAGVSVLTGDILPVKIIWVEQYAPFDVRVMNVPGEPVLTQGYDEWQRLLAEIASCEASGVWPGCDQGESDLEIWQDTSAFEAITKTLMCDGKKMF